MKILHRSILLLCLFLPTLIYPKELLTITGKISDALSLEAIPFANLYIEGEKIGSTSNSEGYFIFKCPIEFVDDSLIISHIGYHSYLSTPRIMADSLNLIYLNSEPILLPEIIVSAVTARSIVERAINKVSSNYNSNPYMITGFYRELIRNDSILNKYAEGVIDVYRDSNGTDLIKLLKGRKRENLAAFKVHKKADPTLGGPIGCFYKDITRYDREFFTLSNLSDYQYSIEGISTLEDKAVYLIKFDRIPGSRGGRYKGRLYIDKSTHAVIRVEYEYNDFGLKKAQPDAVQRSLAKLFVGITFETAGFNATIDYFNKDDQWYIKSVRYSIEDVLTKKGVKYSYLTEKELIVTNLRFNEIKKFKKAELLNPKKEFVAQLGAHDETFWEDYNFLQTTEKEDQFIRSLYKNIQN